MADPTTCEIRDWDIFDRGNWKGELYGPDRVTRIKTSFDELRGVIKPPALKLGHSNDQELLKRLQESVGFPAFGQVTDLAQMPNGRIRAVRVMDVPTEIGGAINAGQFRGGSVELVPFVQDPRDASRRVEGPVLRAIALLGEEPDALPHLPPPVAYFADGRLVPPKPMVGQLIAAMAEVTKAYSLGYRPTKTLIGSREYSLSVLCFSEFTPMPTRDELIAQLLAKGIDVAADPQLQAASDEQLKDLLDSAAEGATAGNFSKMFSSMKKCYAGGVEQPKPGQLVEGEKKPLVPAAAIAKEEAPKWFQAFAAEQKNFNDDMTKRVGGVEKFAETEQKTKTADETKQFSERVGAVVDQMIAAPKPKILRRDRDLFISQGVAALQTATFGEVANNREGAFTAWTKSLAERPAMFSERIKSPETKPVAEPLDVFHRAAIRKGGRLDRESPTVAKKLREAAQAAN